MNYVLDILKSHLRDELIARETANKLTKGEGFHMENGTMQAFNESRRLANERIPQLEKAIKLLS